MAVMGIVGSENSVVAQRVSINGKVIRRTVYDVYVTPYTKDRVGYIKFGGDIRRVRRNKHASVWYLDDTLPATSF